MTAIGTIVQEIDRLVGLVQRTEVARARAPEPLTGPGGTVRLTILLENVEREADYRRYALEGALSMQEAETLDDVLALLMIVDQKLDQLGLPLVPHVDTGDYATKEDCATLKRAFEAALRGLWKHTAGHPTEHQWVSARERFKAWPEAVSEADAAIAQLQPQAEPTPATCKRKTAS